MTQGYPEKKQDHSAQYSLTVPSMVLVSPDGKARARIFYKRNSCCLLGRISVVRSDRTQSPERTRWTEAAKVMATQEVVPTVGLQS